MNDLRDYLRDGDPLNREPALSAADAEAMRRRAMMRAAVSPNRGRHVPRTLVLAITLAAALATGVFFGNRHMPVGEHVRRPQKVEQRQLQFETPGGTRIIWVLNPDFPL